jgi:acetyl esterase/lipase
VHSYLGSADARHPLASPLYGRYSGMPSTRIHVGDDEVLLDDSLRYVDRAVAAGVDARADVWMGCHMDFPEASEAVHAMSETAVRRYPCRQISITYHKSLHFHGGNAGSNPVGDASLVQ